MQSDSLDNKSRGAQQVRLDAFRYLRDNLATQHEASRAFPHSARGGTRVLPQVAFNVGEQQRNHSTNASFNTSFGGRTVMLGGQSFNNGQSFNYGQSFNNTFNAGASGVEAPYDEYTGYKP